MLKRLTNIKAIPLRGGAITAKEKPLLDYGDFSMVQNMRPKHPGFTKRKGQRKLHTVNDSTNKVLSLYQFRKARTDEKHFFAQMSDGDVLEATAGPPTVTTGVFGSEVFDGGANQIPASWGNIADKMLFSNGVDQHKLYGGSTSNVSKFIVYKGSAAPPTIPDEGLDYSDQVTDGQSDTVAVLDSLNTYANHHCIFIQTALRAKSFTFNVLKANGNPSVASLYHWNGAWAEVSDLSDGTNSGGATFGTTGEGTMSFTVPTDTIPKYQFGSNGWWYQLRVSAALDAEVELTGVTYDSPWQDLVNVWNGVLQDVVEVLVEGASQYAVHDSGAVDLSLLASGKKIMLACTDPIEAIYVDPGLTPNATGTSITSLKYWNGSAMASVGTVTDESEGLSKPGFMTLARQSDIQPRQFEHSLYYAYWYEIIFNNTLSDDITISFQCVPYFSMTDFGKSMCNCVWKNRAVYSFDRWSEYIYIAQDSSPMCLNGSDYGILETGDGRAHKIVAMRRFHNELMVWQEEKGVEGGTLTLFQGYSPTTFGKLLISSIIGTMNNNSVAIVEGVLTATATDEVLKTMAFFLSRYGVCASDGMTVSIVSDDIQNYFDPSKDECIRRGYEHKMWLAHDSAANVLRIGLVCGATATECNVFPVFDLVDKTWSFDTPEQELSCMTEVESDSGQAFITQVGGGIDDGFIYQLNYGYADVSTAIDAYITIEFNNGGEFLQFMEMLLRVKAQTQGDFTITPYINGVEQAPMIFPMTPERAGQYSRRIRRGINLQGSHISIKIRNNTLGQEFHLEDFGLSAFVNTNQ